MTVLELRQLIADHGNKYGLKISFPSPYFVDAETYGNVCEFIIQDAMKKQALFWDVNELGEANGIGRIVGISIGPSGGILFKDIELLIN